MHQIASLRSQWHRAASLDNIFCSMYHFLSFANSSSRNTLRRILGITDRRGDIIIVKFMPGLYGHTVWPPSPVCLNLLCFFSGRPLIWLCLIQIVHSGKILESAIAPI